MPKPRDGAALLSEYLDKHKLTREAFAEKVDSTGAAVSRWVSRNRVPGIATAMRIEKATGGVVSVESWSLVERRVKAA